MTAHTIDLLLILAIAAMGAFGAAVLLRWAPRVLTALWCATFFFVPAWIGFQAGVFVSALTVVTLLIMTSAIWSRLELSHVDVLMLVLLSLLVVAYLMGWILWGHLVIVVLAWMIPYVGGRLLPTCVDLNWIYSWLAAGATVAAVLAIVEFLIEKNYFLQLAASNTLYATWGTLQFRGGFLRSEGAFGHSIALGACLAMSSAFILVVRWPAWVRISSLLAVCAAVGLTFSRIGIISLVLTLVGSLFFLRRSLSKQFLTLTTLCLTGAALLGIPQLLQVFSAAGEEASGSAAYRSDLYSLIPELSALGISKSWAVLGDGETYYGTFQSVDSEIVLTGLRYGYVPLLITVAVLISCAVSVYRGGATPAAIAVLAQVPSFATVALITQYANYVWFLAGLAVASYQASSCANRSQTDPRVELPRVSEET